MINPYSTHGSTVQKSEYIHIVTHRKGAAGNLAQSLFLIYWFIDEYSSQKKYCGQWIQHHNPIQAYWFRITSHRLYWIQSTTRSTKLTLHL